MVDQKKEDFMSQIEHYLPGLSISSFLLWRKNTHSPVPVPRAEVPKFASE